LFWAIGEAGEGWLAVGGICWELFLGSIADMFRILIDIALAAGIF
jgi:hypothetical protein